MHGKRVLITGGLGFIGSNLAKRCVELGANVTIYDCLDPRSGGNMQNVAPFQDSLQIVLNDIRNFEGLSAAIMKNDIVFCSAAYTSHPNSMREPLIDIEVNCRGTINILEAARRFNPEAKIVHVGTSTQIGKMVYSPVDEKHPEFPMDIYSANKTVSEKYVLIYATAHRLPATVVRFANVFGPRSNIKSPDFGFVNFFIGLGLQDKEIPVFGTGNQLRNLLYVDDCVDALVLAAEREESSGEVFFAVADEQISVGNIARAISDHIGGAVRSVPWPKDREVIEIGDAIISHEKISTMLGWQPKTDIAAGLAETKEYFGKWLPKYL